VDVHTFTKQARKLKQMFARKLVETASWDRKGVLMVDFMQQETTITSEVYCKTLKTVYSHSEQNV
jgi:hypothetical protein